MAAAEVSTVTASRIQNVKNVLEVWGTIQFSLQKEFLSFREFMQARARNGGKFTASDRAKATYRREAASAAEAAERILNDVNLVTAFGNVGQSDRFDWRSTHKEIFDSFVILMNALGWLALANPGQQNDARLRLAIQVESILANLVALRSSATTMMC